MRLRRPETTSDEWRAAPRPSARLSGAECGRRRRRGHQITPFSAAFREQSELRQHLLRIRAKQRRGLVEAQRRIGETDRADDLRHGARQRMRQVPQHLAMHNLRIGEDFGMLLIGAAGTPSRSSAADQRVPRPAGEGGIQQFAEQVGWQATRAAFVAKRGSIAQSSWPRTLQSFANCPSLPTASTNWPSAQAKTSWGWMLGCRLPPRCGVRPDTA